MYRATLTHCTHEHTHHVSRFAFLLLQVALSARSPSQVNAALTAKTHIPQAKPGQDGGGANTNNKEGVEPFKDNLNLKRVGSGLLQALSLEQLVAVAQRRNIKNASRLSKATLLTRIKQWKRETSLHNKKNAEDEHSDTDDSDDDDKANPKPNAVPPENQRQHPQPKKDNNQKSGELESHKLKQLEKELNKHGRVVESQHVVIQRMQANIEKAMLVTEQLSKHVQSIAGQACVQQAVRTSPIQIESTPPPRRHARQMHTAEEEKITMLPPGV